MLLDEALDLIEDDDDSCLSTGDCLEELFEDKSILCDLQTDDGWE